LRRLFAEDVIRSKLTARVGSGEDGEKQVELPKEEVLEPLALISLHAAPIA
jgi:hypothetical protein